MKITLNTLLFLFSIGVFACDCVQPKITEKYVESEFVARAKIVKNYKNESAVELYKADIIISELFKGEPLKSIYILGRSDDKIGSSCAIFIPENTELIIYARKDSNGKYTVGICSGLFYLNKLKTKAQNIELDILKMFKTKHIDFTDKVYYKEKGKFSKHLKRFKGIELDKMYGMYEIMFTSNLKIKNVTEVSGFGASIDQKLIKVLEKTEWTSFYKGIRDKIPDGSKVLVGVYYYEKKTNHSSFLSEFYFQ